MSWWMVVLLVLLGEGVLGVLFVAAMYVYFLIKGFPGRS